MAPYSTITDIYKQEPESNVIELTDDNKTGIVNTVFVDEAISSADSIIDSYLNGHVTGWPFNIVPNIIKEISVELAIYKIYIRRYGAGTTMYEKGIPEGIIYRYEDAIKRLLKIAKGEIIIGDFEKTKPSIKTNSFPAVFSQEFLSGY
jgi:phage gp36-like protein